MRNYYETLESSFGATLVEIKKAYFKMVRKYPPDKYPEEFMEIRKAYEILSNEKTKKEYDMFASMPEEILVDFEEAKKCVEEDEISEAISLLENILIREPELLIPKSLLGEAYMANGNSGKAVKIYEELVKKEKNNAGFRGDLAHAYLERRYNKKAIKAYKEAIEYDEDNISLWHGLSEAYMMSDLPRDAKNVLQEAIKISTSKEIDSTSIYFKMIFIDIALESDKELEEDLDKLVEVAVQNEDLRGNVTWTILEISKMISGAGITKKAITMLKAAKRIMPENNDITILENQLLKFEKVQDQFQDLSEDHRFSEDIVALMSLEILPLYALGMDKEERDEHETMAEMVILIERQKYISDIKKMKKYYPEIYKIKEEFFEGVLNNKKPDKLLKKYEKKISEMNFLNKMEDQHSFRDFDGDDWYDEEDGEVPFVREEEKIGRNDPCPCGSGKKYKKCCGKNK